MRPWVSYSRIYSLEPFKKLFSTTSRIFSVKFFRPTTTRTLARHGAIIGNVRPLGQIYTCKRTYSSLSGQDGDTIYALSTAPGRAAIAIIRISGPAALIVYQALCPFKPSPKPRYATLRTLYNPSPSHDDDRVLDSSALALYFPAPETVTGEDVLELHVHGGPAVVKAVLTAIPKSLPKSEGQPAPIRYAEPGEFTRRAFYNGRLDLTQIEALGDTLSAETEQQRRLAVRGSSSTLADRYEVWRQKLLNARGELEALIDFSEDQHFDESPRELCYSVTEQVRELMAQLEASIKSAVRGELLRNGINIALIGAPNAGKSSLLNCIVGREAAIVSAEAGTTRDVVDVSVDIGGYLCRFGDLAGLRRPESGEGLPVGEIELEGMKRARERALSADVVIVILSVQPTPGRRNKDMTRMEVNVEPQVSTLLRQLNLESQEVVGVLNKTDLFGNDSDAKNEICRSLFRHPSLQRFLQISKMPIYPISCEDAQMPPTLRKPDPGGIQTLLDSLTQLFSTMTSAITPNGQGDNSVWAEALGATERQRVLLQQCLQHLNNFLIQVGSKKSNEEIDIVLAAEMLRIAAECLARITGRGEAGDVEEVLGVVFEKYILRSPSW